MDAMSKYSTWARANPEVARHIEETAKLVGMFAPAGFGELAFAATNVLALVNDAVLLSTDRPGEDASVRQARWLLSVLAGVDVLLEVIADQIGGSTLKHNAIVLVEAVRAASKLYVLVSSTERIQLAGGAATAALPKLPTKAEDASEPGASSISGVDVPASTSAPLREDTSTPHYWRGRLSGVTIPLPGDFAPHAESTTPPQPGIREKVTVALAKLQRAIRVIASKTPTPSAAGREALRRESEAVSPAVYPAGELISKASGETCDAAEANPLQFMGEVAFILRPLAFAVLKASFGERSWLPLLCSVTVDAFSARCTHVAALRRAGNSELFIPEYATCAVAVSADSVRSAVSALVARVFPKPGATSIGALPAVSTLGTSFAFPNPPGQGPEAALHKALASPKVGIGGLVLRFALWLVGSEPAGMTPAESDELRRRRFLWAMYLLRSPLFDKTVLPVADTAIAAGSWVPLLSTLLRYGRDILVSLNQHHFYSSASS